MGVTEYAVMLCLIVLASLAALLMLGQKMAEVFTYEYVKLQHLAGGS